MVLGGAIGKYVVLGLGAVLLIFFLIRAREIGLGPAAGEVGTSLGNIGQGIGSLGTGIGAGFSGALNPAYTVLDIAGRARNLVFGQQPTPPAQVKVLGDQMPQPGGGRGSTPVQDNNDQTPTPVPVPTREQVNAAILKAHPRAASGPLSGTPVGTFFEAPGRVNAAGRSFRAGFGSLTGSKYFETGPEARVRELAAYYRSAPQGLLTEGQLNAITLQLGRR